MTYRPPAVKQGDGSTCQWSNCGPAAFSVAVGRDWMGRKVGVPKAIRAAIGVYCPGTNSTQNKAAVGELYDTDLLPRYDVPWSAALDALTGGRGVAFVIRYSVVHGTPFDGCRTFDGLHWIYVNELRWNATLGRREALVYDPLCDGRYSWIPKAPQWWPLSLLQKAAQAVMNDGYVDCAFTRSTVFTKKVLYPGGRLRSEARVGSIDKGPLPLGAVYATSGPVTGGTWSINGKSGNRWYRLSSGQYAALGWFAGPTGATA